LENDELLRVRDVAALCKVQRRTVYRWIADGTLPTVRIGQGPGRPRGSLRIRRADVVAAMAKYEAQSAAKEGETR
jgi:excisionase family DNA binding protein